MSDRAAPIGRLDQADIDKALLLCGEGCNLLFFADEYEDVTIALGNEVGGQSLAIDGDGIALYGYGPGETILRSPVFAGPADWAPVIDIGTLVPDGVVVAGMTLDGRKAEQSPPFAAGAAGRSTTKR